MVLFTFRTGEHRFALNNQLVSTSLSDTFTIVIYFAKSPGNQRLNAGTNVMISNVISNGIRNGTVPRVTV